MAVLVFCFIDYRILLSKWSLCLLGTATLALLVVVLLCPRINGAKRWIVVGGFSFQPSELAKLTGTLFFAWFLARKGEGIRKFLTGFTPCVLIAGGVAFLVVLERDLGTPVLLFTVFSLLIVAGGARVWHLLVPLAGGAAAVFYLIWKHPFRVDRILAFLDPWKDPEGAGYQVIQSMVAVQSGGMLGAGLGKGMQKHGFLPAPLNDFIFALVNEELGFVGCLLVIALLSVFVYGGWRIVQRTTDIRAALIAIGIVGTIGVQAIIHMGVVTCLLPTKGIALPFVSAGGSSMLVTAMGVGILLNISAQTPEAEARSPEELVLPSVMESGGAPA